ncbi:hypothetical protein Dimus_024998 [Dionaea muscipula]
MGRRRPTKPKQGKRFLRLSHCKLFIRFDEEKVEEVLVFYCCDESENVAVKEGEEAIEPPISQSGDIPYSDQTPNLVEVETEEVEARAIRKQEIMRQGKTLSSSEESTESEDPV